MNIIAFSGGMGAGKDTIGKIITHKLNLKDPVYFSFAEALREEVTQLLSLFNSLASDKEIANKMNTDFLCIKKARELLNNDFRVSPHDRTPTMRSLLQYWVTEVRRKENPNYWIDIAEKRIKNYVSLGKTVIVTDARFLNELELIHKLNGIIICLVADVYTRKNRIFLRDGILPSEEALFHPSEMEYMKFTDYSLVVDNSYQTDYETASLVIDFLVKGFKE